MTDLNSEKLKKYYEHPQIVVSGFGDRLINDKSKMGFVLHSIKTTNVKYVGCWDCNLI